MINHARTLLLNVSGASSQPQYVGEEYIPANFVPVVLPTYLQLPRRILFGTAPDRYFMNFRAQELMRYLHETELQEFVYQLDPRVTYWPPLDAPFFSAAAKISIDPEVSNMSRLSVQGQPAALNGAGQSFREYMVAIEDAQVTISAVIGSARSTTPVTLAAGLTAAIPFPDNALTLKIARPQNGARWAVTTIAKPAPAVTTLLPTLELLGEPLFLELFGVAPVEPYTTFKNLWFDHPSPVYRMGGLVLAMIYRTEKARSQTRGGN